MIEAAILGRPVLSVLAPEFAGTQEGTVHFHYLLPENGGFLRVSDSIDGNARQLAELLAHPSATAEETSRFVGSFIRPRGLDIACTPLFADAVQQLGEREMQQASRASFAARALRITVWPIALLLHWIGRDGKKGIRPGRALHELRVSMTKGGRRAFRRVVSRPLRSAGRAAKDLSRGVRPLRRRAAGAWRGTNKRIRRGAKVVRRLVRGQAL
jgi:hypothetical protein